ncbi:DUF3307 domain-containing protein [Saccharicrinis fermentans]|uniref:DUF3307 domain-containing protein n=1 Tax=Saccharicrinis fermentans DSM 9555 = JCM 21142 TaxID=869213 RepID=W7Y3W3_9BACT|nr:DUF3307 domain-containing protein [Saccharicrinis fermentans]GAF02273.1 hypothetical protein JCM21142_3902 [Saccharicrinis fermentans DSM 9555 = JCM 21142]
MQIKLILLLFIAHLLADFIFQTQAMSDKKGEKALTWNHIYHVLIVGVLSYIASLNIHFWKAAILLMSLHLITDIAKSTIQLRYPLKNFFFWDQGIHMVIIISVAYAYWGNVTFLLDLKIKTLATIASFIFVTKPTNIIIGNILKISKIQISDSINKEDSLPNAGKLIGIIERLLVLSLILIGQFAAVGLILAAKSILRFNGTQKSEYILIGTLLSFGFAVLAGILITQFTIQ